MPVPLILFSRFANLETFTDPPLTFEHTTPALAYISGKYSLPSAAACEWAHPSRHRERPFGRRGSVFGFLGSIDQSIDVQSIAQNRFVGQPQTLGIYTYSSISLAYDTGVLVIWGSPS